jgi:S-(hydroxymethyl)glutathione dehydrogenase/alcohol dehydrogenase
MCDTEFEVMMAMRGTRPDGNPFMAMTGLGTFADMMTCDEMSLVKIETDVPDEQLALIGCGVTTGVGAALNTANVKAGDTVAVIGCGGVGQSVIQGARIAGAERIIAIDTLDAKLAMAKQFGATDVLLAKAGEDPGKALKKLTGGGPDYAFECVGSGELAAAAYRAIRRGGLAVVVGVAKPSDSTSLRTMTLPFEEKTITGSYFGSCVPRVDFPRMLALYLKGALKLDELITRRYKVSEAPQAFADLESGRNARGVIVF